MSINDRDRSMYESLAGDLLDQRGAPDVTYAALAGEILRHGPRGWLAPDGRRESEAVAVGLWLDHVRATREARTAREAREAADALIAWWDALDVYGCGRDAVRAVAQELRPLRTGPVTIDRVREACGLARAWGFAPPARAVAR